MTTASPDATTPGARLRALRWPALAIFNVLALAHALLFLSGASPSPAQALGAIVGIQGESRFEDSMNAMIVVPTRVDVVNLQPVRSSTPSGPVNPGTLEGSPVTPVPTPTEP